MAIHKSTYQSLFESVFIPAKGLLLYAEPRDHVLNDYLDHWQKIAATALQIENFALQDIIFLFVDACRVAFESQETVNTFSEQQWQLLTQWDALFTTYIHAPDDQETTLALIKGLNHPLLKMGLQHDDEVFLLAGFAPVIAALKSTSLEPETAVATENLPQPSFALNTEKETPLPSISDSTEIQNTSIWQQLETLTQQTTPHLISAIKYSAINQPEALKQSLQLYLESWLNIAQAIETDNTLLGLFDVVLLFIELNRKTFQEIQLLSGKHFSLLNKWQSLFSHYLKTQGSQTLAAPLIKCLSDSLWKGAILPEDEEMLLEGFASVAEAHSNDVAVVTEIPPVLEHALPATELTATDHEPVISDDFAAISFTKEDKLMAIWLAIEADFERADHALKAAVDHEIMNDAPACQHELEHYIQAWQLIADTVAHEESLLGLSDVILLFAELAKQTFAQSLNLNSGQFALLHSWQTHFFDYFKTPNNTRFAAALISSLKSSFWSNPIAAEDEMMLLEMLGVDDAADQVETQAEQTPKASDADLKPVKNAIWQSFELFFVETQAQIQALREFLILKNNVTCLNYLQSYADNWSVIAEIIAENGENLQTLAEVTLLFADNCSEWVEQNLTISTETIALLQQWHQAFKVSLQDTHTTPLELLIACLESPLWLRPLTSEDKAMLLELMEEESLQVLTQNNDHELLLQEVFSQDDDEEFAFFGTDLDAEETIEMEFVREDVISETKEVDEKAFLKAQSVEDFLSTLEQENETDDFTTEKPVLDSAQVQEIADLPTESATADFVAMLAQETETNDLPAEEPVLDIVQETKTDVLPTEDSVLDSAQVQEIADLPTESAAAEFVVIAKEPKTLAASVEPPRASVNPELIGMVHDEFALLVSEISDEITAAADVTAFKSILKNHQFKFDNLAKACNTIGLLGLEQVFAQLSLNMRSRRDSDIFTETESELFKQILPLIQDYISAITDPDTAATLVAHLGMPGWKFPLPLADTQNQTLLALLSGLSLSTHTEQLHNRKTLAEPSDVSLLLPDDVNSDLLNSLLDELPVSTGKFSAVIQHIISGKGTVEQLLEAQRIAHTLKGSGNIVGVTGIAVVTHHLEEILEYLTKHKLFPTKRLANVLLESADCLEMMGDLLINGETEPPEQALQVLQNVLDWANEIANGGLPAEIIPQETTTLPAEPNTDLTPVLQEAKTTEAVAMTRVPNEVIDELLRMTGEASILNEQFKERVKRFSQELKNLNELTWQMQSLVAELDQAINIQSYSSKTNRSSINSEFDALEMEQYNELHTAASRISETATDIREMSIHLDEQLVDFKYLMADEDAIQKENQEIVQRIRMVPANTIASRCQRIVRQACRATNKEVALEIKGADILIDSEILNDMVEPLMHLLRNSVDHGIEPASIRERLNKPPVGKITLSFSRKGNYAVISCQDDGGGLSSGSILQTAIKKGLITAKQQLTDAEIHKLILIPGFSTRAVATQTSGRGIGMDAIQTKISTMQGQMTLHSERGVGLNIEITIPLTLSSMLSLLIKCGGQTMAISNRGLRKIHHADECTLIQEGDDLYCLIDETRYRAKHFAELVGMQITYDSAKKLQGLQIADEIGRTHLVFVEELLGYRDLLVKNMGSYIPHIQGITGASILGNGDVAPVIDLVEMLHNAAKYDYVIADATKALSENISGLPLALVIDDSLSARRSVAMLLKDSGILVETAIDGLDAIKHLDKVIPDIILVDLEMPRMNGIELAAHVRGREDMKNTPIIMITSRATDKHRRQAEAAGVTKFMTKPFTEDDLINSVRGLMR